jgi:hypothetical protein
MFKQTLSLLIICSFWGLSTAVAQGGFPTSANGQYGTQGTPDRSQGEFDEQILEEPDTFGVFIFFAENPNVETPFGDTILHRHFQQYDPARQRELDWRTLGNLGSASEPIVYQPRFRRGFDTGLIHPKFRASRWIFQGSL